VLENGARAVLIRPRPPSATGAHGRSDCPSSIPSGARSNVQGFRCASTRRTPSSRPTSTSGSRRAPPERLRTLAVPHDGRRPRDIEDTIASLVCHGTLSRFPDLRLASVENARVAAPPHGKPRPGGAHDAQEFSGDPSSSCGAASTSTRSGDDLRQLIELVVPIGALRVGLPHPKASPSPATTPTRRRSRRRRARPRHARQRDRPTGAGRHRLSTATPRHQLGSGSVRSGRTTRRGPWLEMCCA